MIRKYAKDKFTALDLAKQILEKDQQYEPNSQQDGQIGQPNYLYFKSLEDKQ
jgi:hypothetical protein